MIDRPLALFDRYHVDDRPIAAVEPLGNAGGLSGASLFRYQSSRGLLVARCWPVQGPNRPDLEQIHAWLGQARDLPCIPQPLATVDGATLVDLDGRTWEITPLEARRGRSGPTADLDPPPPGVRRDWPPSSTGSDRVGPLGQAPAWAHRATELERLISVEFRRIGGRLVLSRIDRFTAAGSPAGSIGRAAWPRRSWRRPGRPRSDPCRSSPA